MDKLLRDDEILILTTTKDNSYLNNDMSFNSDEYQARFNRFELAKRNNFDINNLYIPKQKHSDVFKEIKDNQETDLSNCDALYTKDEETYLGVLTADCLPLLIYFPDQKIVAAIHAGWVGSVKLITYKLITHLIIHEQVNPKLAQVYLGPSICKDVYEVGQDVYDQACANEFIATESCFTSLGNNKYLFDNRLFNLLQLKANNIDEANIKVVCECKLQRENYFSYRENKTAGRQLSLIGMRAR